VYNVKRLTEMPAGGHFAAMEEPAALAVEIRAFFRDRRGCRFWMDFDSLALL
jgi:hypothetical protein